MSISDVTVSSEGRARYLECDEVCAQEERHRKLAAALEIDNPNLSPVDSEIQYSSFLLEQARYYMYTVHAHTCSLLSGLPDLFNVHEKEGEPGVQHHVRTVTPHTCTRVVCHDN